MGERRTISTTASLAAFTLALPPELASIKPLWSIPLPRKHVAHIYSVKTWDRTFTDGKQTDTLVDGYEMVLVNSKGAERQSYHTHKQFTADDTGRMRLKAALEQLAIELTPKTKRTVDRDEYLDDED